MNIKNRIFHLSLILLVGLVINANAGTSFQWFNTSPNNLTDNLGAAIEAAGATILTYLSTDATIDFNETVLLADIYGNDFFYQALGNTQNGWLVTEFMNKADNTYTGYYAYAVVLDLDYSTFLGTYNGNVNEVLVGTHYDVTPIFGGLTEIIDNPPTTPDRFDAGNLTTIQQVVPEPTVIALLGAGGLTMLVGRRIKFK